MRCLAKNKDNSVSIAPDIDSHNSGLPKHIAIIMDGNNRWAKANSLLVVQATKQVKQHYKK